MNILMVTDDLLLGGAARHVVDLSNELSQRGHSVTLAATDGPMRKDLHPSVPFVPLSLKNNKTMGNDPFGAFSSFVHLYRTASAGQFDIIHSHKRYVHALCSRLPLMHQARHVTSFHSDVRSKRWLTVMGDAAIGCSESITASLHRQFPGSQHSIVTIRNGVQPLRRLAHDELNITRTLLGIPEGSFVFGSVGQFVPEKDRASLLRAVQQIVAQENIPPMTILIQGYGPQEHTLKQLSIELGLDPFVRFIPGDRLVEQLCSVSDCMVLNSVTEGFPLILLEAASVATPHIASNVGGIPEFIESERNGLLVPPSDPSALADAMHRVLLQPALAATMGKEALQDYQASFTFPSMVDRIEGLYRSIRGDA